MRCFTTDKRALLLTVSLISLLTLGCLSEYIPVFLGGGNAKPNSGNPFSGSSSGARTAFSGELIQARTFTNGTAVTTTTYLLDDLGDADVIDADRRASAHAVRDRF